MIDIVAFRPEHLNGLMLQQAQAYFGGEFKKDWYVDILRNGDAFTALSCGQVIACSGCIEMWENVAKAWALIGADIGRDMLQIHRAVAGYLMAAKWKRIEADVDAEFDEGIRWIELLGFTRETPEPRKAYRPDGGASYLYARVRQ